MHIHSPIFTNDQEITSKIWYPNQVIFTADSLKYEFTQKAYDTIKGLGIPVIESKNNRITGIKGKSDAETYRNAKSTLAMVKAPKGMFQLQPIPPSADFQFHLAHGCPAHCQYCYLAGSLQGLPVTRVYGNLKEILDNTVHYEKENQITTFEASCYTDPLALEPLTGSLSETIKHFSERPLARLRWVSKFDSVKSLLSIQHNGHTRARISLNAKEVTRKFEAGAASLESRLNALARLSSDTENTGGAYPIGLVIAPIIAFDNWKGHYETLFNDIKNHIGNPKDLTFEFITHRFTESSKKVLLNWYKNTRLNMSEKERSVKFNKFGGSKFVYHKDLMKELKAFFEQKVDEYFPGAEILYWT